MVFWNGFDVFFVGVGVGIALTLGLLFFAAKSDKKRGQP